MALPERFGPYVVVGAIGSGGMGEVYRARDPRLNRQVAIKVLARAGSDPVRQRRFTGEAQAASALNHPNILTVYDVGVHDEVPYIVSELVAGESIRTLLARAPLPIREVLDLGAQMADGLAAAHQAGIVHRDFKPENVMVTPGGRVKILDFGLALVGTREATGSREGDVTLTHAGLIVGTVPYMSPEQARGASVDYRTDQFSLGLTLYEMLTGRRAFQAETAPQTLAAILEDEPEPIAKRNARVPAPLRWVIERCLAKDPRQRYESTTDLARDLRTLRDRVTEVASVSDLTPAIPRRRWRAAVIILMVAAMTGAAGVIVGRVGDGSGARLDRYRFTPFATDAGYQASPAWSPDGKTVAYVAAVDGVLQVFTKAVGSPLRAQVTHSRFDCREVFWGADGTRLYYISLARDRDGLWSISAVGGEPEFVMENVSRAAMSPDGKTLALLRSSNNDYGGVYSLWLSSPPESPPVRYTRTPYGDPPFFDGIVRFTPDGSKLGLWAIRARAFARPEFWVVPFNGEAPYLAPSVTSSSPRFAAPFSWLPDNRHLVSALPFPRPGVHLWILDTKSVDAQLITTGGSIENDPAVSPDGTRLVSTFQQANYDVYKVSVDRHVVEPVLASSRNEMDPAWSPASSQMAFTTDRSGSDEIWLRSQAGDFERPLVTAQDFPKEETYLLGSPAFSPDGQRVAYYREAQLNHIWISPVAGGPPVELSPAKAGVTNVEQDLPTWSPDGKWIAFPQDSGDKFGLWAVVKMRVGTQAAPQVVVSDIVPLSSVKWSPNGSWIAYSGREGLSIVAPDGTSAHAISDEPWMAYVWSEDSRRLFGIRPSDDFKHLTLTSVDVVTRGEHVLQADLMPMPVAARPIRGFTRVSDTTFLTSIVRVSSDIWLFDGFRPAPTFWAQLLSRLPLSR
jgi:eukaryotic-like serine/threonine-protein kinase